MTEKERLLAIHDLASTRLFNLDSAGDPNVTHDLTEIAHLSSPDAGPQFEGCKNCPFWKHVHFQDNGKLTAPGCSGYEDSGERKPA